MKILYNYWGYLSDKIGISSADGNFSYSWSIINELVNRGIVVYGPPIDRDHNLIIEHGFKQCFSSFSRDKRSKAYIVKQKTDLNNLPDVDILLLEWRFKTHYNQAPSGSKMYHPDLKIQTTLLSHYSTKDIRLRIMNLDNKITQEDEEYILSLGYKDVKILEQSIKPDKYLINRETMFIPFDMSEILQFDGYGPRDRHLTYIGNDYNRHEDIEQKIIPYAQGNLKKVMFIGNWMREDQQELRNKWSCIEFRDRVGAQKFLSFLSSSIASPLLAPENYKKSGTMTMRLLESILFGTIPIGFSDFLHIKFWLFDDLIVDTNDCLHSMTEVLKKLSSITNAERRLIRENLSDKLQFHDAKFFVEKILR